MTDSERDAFTQGEPDEGSDGGSVARDKDSEVEGDRTVGESASGSMEAVGPGRTQRLARRSGPRKIRVVADSAAQAHAEDQATRGMFDVVAASPDCPSPVAHACGTPEASLFLLFVPGVEESEKTCRESAVAGHRACVDEYAAIWKHLALHKASPAPAYPHDGFSRLKARLRREGYLKFAWPGTQSLWRRSFAVAAAAAAVLLVVLFFTRVGRPEAGTSGDDSTFGTLTILDSNGNPLRQPRSLGLGQQETVREGAGYLWLPTGERGNSVQVRLREGAKFKIDKTSLVSLDEGEATEVIVTTDATVNAAFVLATRKAELRTEGATFSVETDESSTTVYVYTGAVNVKPLGGGETRHVPRGHGMSVKAGEPPRDPFPLVELSIEAVPGRVLNATIRNRSTREISISKAIGPDDFPYWLFIDQDKAGATEGDPLREEVQSIPLPGVGGSRGDYRDTETHRDLATLAPEGRGGQSMYQFSVDLGSVLAGAEAADFTMVMEYRGRIVVGGLGPLGVKPVSRSIRYDTKRGSAD